LKRRNLWAPWRMKYIRSLSEESQENGCFICAAAADKDKDSENLLLWRTGKSVVMFNRFPYNNGHLLIAPIRHIADFSKADDDELLELTKLMRESQKVLELAVQPHGFNIGINLGRCAGAGLPGHLHIHVVPRWDGDCSFMSVCSDTDVISQGLNELFDELKDISVKNNLPNL